MLNGGNFQYLVVFAGDDSLYGIDLKIKLEREIAKKIVLGKWSPIVNADDLVPGWKVAKDWCGAPSLLHYLC